MGAWGTAIFSDDTACDVRDDWRELVGDGLTGPQATDKLLTRWADSLTDPDDGPVFWLALAATQSRGGLLEDRVKAKALGVIQDGTDLKKWGDDPALQKKRKAVLDKLREQLLAAQPSPKKIRRATKATCDWEIGDVIALRLRSGKLLLFRVIQLCTDRGGTYPYCQFYDWIGDDVPSSKQIAKLPIRRGVVMMCGATQRKFPADRIRPTGIRTPVETEPPDFGVGVWLWSQVDQRLEDAWGVK